MLLLLIVLSIGLIVCGNLIAWYYDDLMIAVGTGLLVIFVIAIIPTSIFMQCCNQSAKKIEMYESENKQIEQRLDTVVKNYMEYEGKTFETSKSGSSMTLVSLYPELKSDKLVVEQMKVYNSNNAKIKKLKETQIDGSVARWWVYFGK